MTNIVTFRIKYPLMPVPEALYSTASQLREVADLFEQQGDRDKAGDLREAAYFIGKVAMEVENKK